MSPTRTSVLGLSGLVALGLGFALVPARGQQQFHRHQFSGRETALVRGDANVRVEEKEHDISTGYFKSQPSSEHVKLVCDAGTGDAAFVHYFYETPPAPVNEVLSAGVWVKATKNGVQLRARVVFPKEPDPARPEAPLTMLVVGKTYEKSRDWDKLTLGNVPELIGKHLPVLQAKIGRAVNTADAYIDRLVLNLYAGPGPLDVWIDDLDIGPVVPAAREKPEAPGLPAKQPRDPAGPSGRGHQIEYRGGQLEVDGKARFFRAIRHTGTPLHVLRSAGFDTLWVTADAPTELVEEAGRDGWLLVPSVPPVQVGAVGTGAGRDADLFAGFLRKFAGSDVLFWDLGGGLTEEQIPRIELTSKVIREAGDRRRPLGGDLWDGFGSFGQYLDVVGAHRWPLFTSLELSRYRDWLAQRRMLLGGRGVFWTWVQNHLPEWYVSTVLGKGERRGVAGEPVPAEAFPDPVGPHPEQVRLLAYISVASGCRGLGFWSDRFLADTHHGRDRLQGMALLNTELDMLSPVLLSAGMSGARTQWLDTSNGNVKAAVIATQKGMAVLPMWLGGGCQYVPDQAAVAALQLVVPGVPDGADPWLLTPAGVTCLRENCKKVTGGTQLTIPEFDTAAAIVFTADLSATGIVVWWQDHCRKYGRLAARWALDLAASEYEKVTAVHAKLAAMNVTVRGSENLLQETNRYYNEARKHFAAELYDKAYQDATRALRPLRVLMRDHWQQAVATLDLPTASPYAVSFFSLPQHWELFGEVRRSQPGANALPHGGFEFSGDIPKEGVRVDGLPGWTARFGSLEGERVLAAAGVVPAEGLADNREPRKQPDVPRNIFSPSRPIAPADEGYVPPAPELGGGVLKLEVRARTKDGKPVGLSPVLERTFLAVDSPPVRLPPGTLVRVSGWVKVPGKGDISGTVDGVLFYDDAGGEPLGVRLTNTRDTDPRSPPDIEDGKKVRLGKWKQFHLYRRVPASGQIAVTVALTGFGTAYFDDLRIEPLVPGAGDDERARKAGGTGVTPASYRPR